MKKIPLSIFFGSFLILMGCNPEPDQPKTEQWKQEIIAVEKSFNDMAQTDGLVKAFEFFAAEDGVIRRRRTIIKGKEAIGKWYMEDVRPGDTLTWTPTFVDVSLSGDLGYTYGNFRFTYLDSLGNTKQSEGIFHTVWKRQADGNWRFVWD